MIGWLLGESLGPGRLEWMASASTTWLVWLGGVLVLVLSALGGRTAVERRLWEGVFTTLAVVLLGVMLLRPTWVEESGRDEPGRMVILVDQSASMAVVEGGKPRSEGVGALLGHLGADHDVFHFSNALGVGPPQDYLGAGTDFAAALQAVADRYAGQKLRGLAVISDGIDRGGLRAEQRDGRPMLPPNLPGPVTFYQVGEGGDLVDESVEDLMSGGFAFLRTPFAMTARFRGAPNGKLEATLTREGRLVRRALVALDDKGEGTTTFEVTPTQVGRFAYDVSIPTASEDAVPGNNSMQTVVRVVRDRTRVLQVCGSPSYDQKFLRLFLKEDPSVDLVSFFILRTTSDLNAGWRTPELSLIQFPYERLFTTDLHTFDLVILQNFDYAPYFEFDSDLLLGNIAQYVREGGALVMTGGDRSFDLGRYAGTPIEDVLPVKLGVTSPTVDAAPFRPVLTEAGQVHPISRLASTTAESQMVWERLPEMDGLNLNMGPTPDAGVLLGHPTLKTVAGGPMPVVAVREVDRGRTMAMAVDSSWRWSFTEAAEGRGNQAYLRFWKNTMRWLVADPDDRRVVVSPVRENVQLGSEVRLVVRVRDTSYGPVAERPVKGTAVGPNGDVVSFEVVTDSNGEATTTLAPEVPGAYRVQVSSGPGSANRAETVFAVAARDPELSDIRPDGAFLRALAESYGGAYYPPGELGEPLVDPGANRQINERREVDLSQAPLLAGAFGLSFGLAIWFRRRAGAR